MQVNRPKLKILLLVLVGFIPVLLIARNTPLPQLSCHTA